MKQLFVPLIGVALTATTAEAGAHPRCCCAME